MQDRFHVAFHKIFSNKDPVEQIVYLINRINTTALTEEFKHDINKILEVSEEDYYFKD
jgi:hypothetical protein